MLCHDELHSAAHAMGFNACGITRVHIVPDDEMRHFDAWLAQGCAAGMTYMHNHRDIRRDPTLLLPGAKTIVCLAMGYTPSAEIEGIAHYAYGRDYHEVVRERATQVAQMVQASAKAGHTINPQADTNTTTSANKRSEACATFRVCIDTAPIMERYWAQECGLGWIGRNHQLIVPHAGSEFFLCEILFTDETDLVDTPIKSRCGTCHRCLDVCPTGALRQDGMLDARLCNSYLTIEHRGEWTEHVPSPDCIYGCDHCQRVCPWQRFAEPTNEPAFQPSARLQSMTSRDWQELSEEQFREMFRNSAVKRTKYDGIMRNIRHKTPPTENPEG